MSDSNTFLLDSHNNNSYGKIVDSVWQPTGPDSNGILGFSFNNQNADIIYAASRDSGVFKTINGGRDNGESLINN